MQKPEEKKLLIAIKKGDLKSFEFLFRFYYEPLVRYASRYTKFDGEAEEIVQELFLKLWRDKKKIKIKQSIPAYLYRAVYNQCLQLIQKENMKIKHQNELQIIDMTGDDPEELMKYQELNHRFFLLMEQLPERTSTIFKMSRFQGMKYKEIAQRLSISVKTVEANMSKALDYFRIHLKEYRI
jgi:RNA polymerase sigma-70 factor (ECF subfamily)